MRKILAGGLSLSLGLLTGTAFAQAPAARAVIAATPGPAVAAAPAASLGQPIPLATLGAPVTVASYTEEQPAPGPRPLQPIARAQMAEPTAPTRRRGAAPALPVLPAVPAPPATPAERYNCGVVTSTSRGGWWDNTKEFVGNIPTAVGGVFTDQSQGRALFQSDHCFDGFISPVSNPFYFEDPRSLTELRPLVIFQGAPSSNYIWRGGNLGFFGVQGRLAISDHLSLVMSKLGGVWTDPYMPGGEFTSATGFAEVNIGPKFTFLRNDQCGTLGAFGLTFEIPDGSHKVFQDNGSLSLVPYVSMGQNFLRSSYGSFNALGTVGYEIATDSARSDKFFTSAHLDYDVGNLHKIYPLLELNWFSYTKAGTNVYALGDGVTATKLGFEGADLINFGANGVAGHNFASMALGMRYKFCEAIQFGGAYEFPITGRRDLMDYRLTFDAIFRY